MDVFTSKSQLPTRQCSDVASNPKHHKKNRTNHSLAMHHSGNEYQIHIQTRSTDYSFPNAERKSPSKKCCVSTIKGACQVENACLQTPVCFPCPYTLWQKKMKQIMQSLHHTVPIYLYSTTFFGALAYSWAEPLFNVTPRKLQI